MEFSQMMDTLRAMTPSDQRSWLTHATLVLTAMLLALWIESRFFKRSQRVGSWLAVRLVTLLIAPVTLALLILPAQSVSGMEGLVVFYAMLLTVAPLLWFGSHALAARWVRPRLSTSEGLVLAFSGLAILAIPALALAKASGALQDAARDIGRRNTVPADNPALAHQPQAPLRVAMVGAGEVFSMALVAPPDVQLVKVEQRRGGTWPTDGSSAQQSYCTQGNDVHLMWSAQEQAPYLRLHWLAVNGARQHSEFTPSPSALAAATTANFSIQFRDDGLDPLVPVPRSHVELVMTGTGGQTYRLTLSGRQPGDPPGPGLHNDCLIAGHTRPNRQQEGLVQAVGITFYVFGRGSPLRAMVTRPD